MHGTVELVRMAVRWTVAIPGELGPLADVVAAVVSAIRAPMRVRGLLIVTDLHPGAAPMVFPDEEHPVKWPCARSFPGVFGVDLPMRDCEPLAW